ncbi:hypothetical protein TURTL08_16150 [Turicimonas sp. TL08]
MIANLLLLLSLTAKKTHKMAAATQAAESPKISMSIFGENETICPPPKNVISNMAKLMCNLN